MNLNFSHAPSCFFIFLMGIVCSACSTNCNETFVTGEDAIPYIQRFENAPPGSTFEAPDSLLMSSTKEVESFLDSLKLEGLLNYQLVDSVYSTRELRIDPIPVIDSTLFYTYRLKWKPSLDEFRVESSESKDVVSMELFNRSYNGEFRYNSITFSAGRINYYKTDSLYFKDDCAETKFRYSYEIDSLNNLAKFIGFNSFQKKQRTTTNQKSSL